MRAGATPPRRRLRPVGGTPVEEAPWWALALLVLLLALVAFPAVVGLLAGLGRWHGQHGAAAAGAVALALAIVAAVATRRPWRRAPPTPLHDPRPLAVRFSTWLITALLLPNVLFGFLVLAAPRPAVGYRGAALAAAAISAVHGAWAALDRRRRATPGG
jgi:formate hydrogenlyase subunit 3/multisubunit Na+/H+ antiporter MnhD subunit